MKKIIFLLSISLLLCGGILKAQTVKEGGTKTATVKAKNKLIIAFISKGNGIDGESFNKIENFIKEHPKKPAYETVRMGKEGETEFRMKLTEFTKSEQAEFTNQIKNLIVKHDLVLINGKHIKPAPLTPGTSSDVNKNYRLVLEFISMGNGPDREALPKIREYIAKHPKKPAVETYTWGREGETDLCLKLTELTPEEQVSFIKDINKLITNKEMVHVLENQPYVKKGR